MKRFQFLILLTREGTNIFTEVINSILNILPGNWGSTNNRANYYYFNCIRYWNYNHETLKTFLLVLSTTYNRSGQFCSKND